jgi:hypothetical protein
MRAKWRHIGANSSGGGGEEIHRSCGQLGGKAFGKTGNASDSNASNGLVKFWAESASH